MTIVYTHPTESTILAVRRKAQAALDQYAATRNPLEAEFDRDLGAFRDLYALPLLDAHAEVMVAAGAQRAGLRSALESAALDIVEDILPDRSLSTQLDGLPEDVDTCVEYCEVERGFTFRVLADGTRLPASERMEVCRAEHGEWERRFGLASFVRGQSSWSLTIRDVIGQSLRARIFYWVGQAPLNVLAAQAKESVSDRALRRDKVVAPLLLQRGWSNEQWASQAGVEYKTAVAYRHGKTRALRAETRECLAGALQLSPEDLPE